MKVAHNAEYLIKNTDNNLRAKPGTMRSLMKGHEPQ